MNKERYKKHLNTKCNDLSKKEKEKIVFNDTISSFLLIAGIAMIAGYCWLNYVALSSWPKWLFLGLTGAFFVLAIFLVFWRFARKNEKRVKTCLKWSAKIDLKGQTNKILTLLNEEEREYYKKQSLKLINALTIFYIIFYLIIASVMFILMFAVNGMPNIDITRSAPIVTFFMYTGICALLFGMVTTPIFMLEHNMLPEDDQIKLYIASNPKVFKSKLQ